MAFRGCFLTGFQSKGKKIRGGAEFLDKKNAELGIRILQLMGLLGEMTADEIISFSNSPTYTKKVILTLKKDGFIKIYKNETKLTYRLRQKGKKYLSEKFPESFSGTFKDKKISHGINADKRIEERRKKLLEILSIFHRADIKIFPDEKVILKNRTVITCADPADFTDFNATPEFYTSKEIKNIIPDYKKGIGSRALGILISYGRLYIVYLTHDGNLFWHKSTEMEFYINTKLTLAKMLFEEDRGIYLLVISSNRRVPAIIMKRKYKPCGKIYPCAELQNMIFALSNIDYDATLKFILTGSCIPDKLETVFRAELISDKKNTQYDGVMRRITKDASGNIATDEFFGICAFRFDLRKIMDGIDAAVKYGKKVMIFCFDYQREYITAFLRELKEENNKNIEILSNSIEGYMEGYLNE